MSATARERFVEAMRSIGGQLDWMTTNYMEQAIDAFAELMFYYGPGALMPIELVDGLEATKRNLRKECGL